MHNKKTVTNKILIINTLLIFCLFGILFFNSQYLMHEIRRTNEIQLNKSINLLADRFENESKRLNDLITLSNTEPDFVLSMVFSSSNNDYINHVETTMEKLSLMKNSISYADDVYLYSSLNNKMITTDSLFNADYYTNQPNLSLETIENSNGLINVNSALYYIRPIKNYGSLVIDINNSAFLDMLCVDSVLTKNKKICICSSTGDVILQNDPAFWEPNYLKEIKGNQFITLQNQKYYSSMKTSPLSGSQYFIFDKADDMEINLVFVNSIVLISIGASVLLSLIIIFKNYQLYKPIQNLLLLINNTGNESINFKQLEEKIKAVTTYQEEISKKEAVDISLYYQFYNSVGNSLTETSDCSSHLDHYVLLFACQNKDGKADQKFVSELCSKFAEVISVPCDSYMTAFVIPAATLPSHVIDFIRNTFSGTDDMKVFVSYSKPVSDDFTLHDAFTEALTVLQSTKITAAESFIIACEKNQNDKIRYLSLDVQQQIVNCVQRNQDALFEEVLSTIMNGNSCLREYRNTCKTINSLLEYLADNFEFKKINIISHDFDIMINPLYMKEVLCYNFHSLSKYYQEKSQLSLSMKICAYIENHYSEPLSVEYIASHFSITPTYLSTFFKKETGINLSTYIRNLRITKAQKLLIETDLKINEIAEKIGVPSQSTFVRQFKNFSGCLPTEYRQTNHQ